MGNFTNKIIVGITVNSLSLYLAASLILNNNIQGGIKLYIIAGTILGLLNILVKPILKIVSFPLMIITGGLFIIFINTILLYLVSDFIIFLEFPKMALDFGSFINYLIAGLIVGLLNWFTNLFTK